MIQTLFPTRPRPPQLRPHRWALFIWATWNAVFVGTMLQPDLKWFTLATFLLLELAALRLSATHPFGITLSEVVWWYIPWKWARWLLAVVYGLTGFLLIDPRMGAALLLWLVPHFVMVGREYAKRAKVVEVFAQATADRDPDTFQSSVAYIEGVTSAYVASERAEHGLEDDPELVREVQQAMVRRARLHKPEEVR